MSFDIQLNNGDFVLDPQHSLGLVFNDDKLRQDLVKVVLTPIGSNKLYPWYGSPITEKSLGKVFDQTILSSEITNSIIFSINNLMTLQKDQTKSGQYVSASESISRIIDVNSELSVFDSRQVNINISVATRRASVVEESFKLRV